MHSLINLQKLYLQSCQIVSLPTGLFGNLANLLALHLEYNNLDMLNSGTFIGLVQIQQIYLNNNVISTCGDIFYPFTKLQVLDIRNNPVSSQFKSFFNASFPL